MTDDVERIAKGLTKAQREAVIGDASAEITAIAQCVRDGLLYANLAMGRIGLTEKGQQVRQYLERNS